MSDLDKYFRFKCHKGMKLRGLDTASDYESRLQYEMGVIVKMGFPGYFLIVADLINWAKNNDIYIGPGRGSAAGSLVSYVLGITDIDPIRWGLLFERFLNPDRISMPDIDIDVEKKLRDKVLDYITNKYGAEHVAHIGTFNMHRAKAAVRSVAKTLGHPYSLGDGLAKLLLPPIHGKPQSLKLSVESVRELRDFYEDSGPEGEILRWAEKVEDHISSVGVHASGMVISNNSLIDSVPLFRGRSEEVTTQWEMGNIEEVGLIKFDILGLDALTKIHNCIDIIKARTGKVIDITKIDLCDEKVFAGLRAGDNVGLFQLETSSGMRDLMIQIRPTNIEDITALVAIYRPGPLASDYKNVYLRVRAGRQDPEYLVPELEPILKPTGGWLIYQEQAMNIAKTLCGYTGGQADDLRKAIGKKIPEKMAKHEKGFKAGWVDNGLPEAAGTELWDQMVSFSDYAFNKSHAAAYAFITYQTAWLKTYYPSEFMCAIMISDAGNTDQMIKYLSECRRLGIQVLPPDINESKHSFHVDGQDNIRFGLGPIKNLGESSSTIIAERQSNGSFTSLRDFCERVDLGVVNRGKIESLIRAGAFDPFGMNRATMLAAVEDIWNYRTECKRYTSKMETFQKKSEAYHLRMADIEEAGKLGKKTKLKPLSVPEQPVQPQWPELKELDEMPKSQLQSNEHELLGFYVSSHPLEWTISRQFGLNLNKIEDIKEMPAETKVSLAVVITSKTEITTKKSDKMAFLVMEDLTGTIEGAIFPKIYAKFAHLMNEIQPLRVDASVDVVEADDRRAVKLVIWGVSPLILQQTGSTERIEANVPATRAQEFLEILKKYEGDVHDVVVTFRGHDGTSFRCPDAYKICNQKAAFIKEIAKLQEG